MSEELKPLTKHEVSERLASAMQSAILRFETIRETHPDISLDHDIEHYREALAWYRRIPSLEQREAAWNEPAEVTLPRELVEEVTLAIWRAGFHSNDVESGEADLRIKDWPDDWEATRKKARAILPILERERLAACKAGIEAGAHHPEKRANEWKAAIKNGLQRICVSRKEAFAAQTENEVAVFNIRALDPAQVLKETRHD